MRSSELHRSARASLVGLTVALAIAAGGRAEAQAQGFALERLYSSPAGGGWLVMDALDMQGGLGGAIELIGGAAVNPFVVSSGGQRLAVVSEESFAELGLAVTYARFRLSLNLDSPLSVLGKTGTVGGTHYAAPSFDLGQDPDTIADPRLGFDARIYGAPRGAFRLGASVQLYFPSGTRADYLTDGTGRGMIRALVAGDIPWFTYAAQLGVHVRPLDETTVPGAPRGSELLFGVAAGVRLHAGNRWGFVVGPEIFGATAFRSFFGQTSTALEGLLSARFEGTGTGLQLRVKLGAGGGLDAQFGAPEWRIVGAVEIFNRGSDATRVLW
jgi:hypothetical protein